MLPVDPSTAIRLGDEDMQIGPKQSVVSAQQAPHLRLVASVAKIMINSSAQPPNNQSPNILPAAAGEIEPCIVGFT
jgi:hypothetical protein